MPRNVVFGPVVGKYVAQRYPLFRQYFNQFVRIHHRSELFEVYSLNAKLNSRHGNEFLSDKICFQQRRKENNSALAERATNTAESLKRKLIAKLKATRDLSEFKM